jgi:hypothetical protein
MSYRNKTYVIFDGDNDRWAYAFMNGWKSNENMDFNFHDAHDIGPLTDRAYDDTIKARLRERFSNAKQAIVLVGENTKNLRKWVPWQRTSLSLTRLTLIFLVLGAGSAAISSAFDSARSGFAIASAISLAFSIGFSIFLKILKPEQIWYGGRAVAESVKSMTWRYMMDADPYSIELAPAEVDRKFVAELKSIVRERRQLAFGLGGEFTEQPQITARMRELRAATLEQRKAAYVAERISDQRNWYGQQAESNRAKSNIYFILIVLSQFLGLFTAFALITDPYSSLKFTGLFTSLAGALIAWLQIKQHKEQAQSYSIAELELGFVQQEAQYVTDERTLSDFVGDAENAISREHTLWVARRDRI